MAGLVLVRQRPGSASSVFMTLEDETGIANAILWERVFEAHRAIVMGTRLVAISGKVQKESGVVHLIADHLTDLSPMLKRLSLDLPEFSKDAETAMPKGRNFH